MAPDDVGEAEAVASIAELLRARTGRADEAAVLARLRGLEGRALDRVVSALDVGALVSSVQDRAFGPDHRLDLLRLLARERLADLGVAARARLVGALQEGRTGAGAERAIRDVFLGTRGRDLTALKNALDGGRGHRDLHQLLFHDIDDAAVRAEIVAHVEREAASLPAGRRELKVLSDIDDTVYANWKDERFPAKTVYPGVLALFRELDRGPGEEAEREGDLTFVSARPGDRAGLVERRTLEGLRERGVPAATMLAGSFRRLIGNARIAQGKYERFDEYRRLYPEYAFAFIGDSGQGDAVFGARLVELHPASVVAVLIHDVVATPEREREEQRRRGVLFFDTYVGAAVLAYERGLIHREGLLRVARAAEGELAAIAFQDGAARAARQAELARDVHRIAAATPPVEP